MELRPFGNSGLRTSPIGLGLFKLGRNLGAKHPQAYELPTDDQAARLLRTAAELGVNVLDTAPSYGVSERRLGQLMKSLNWLGGRERWVICTKVGEEFDDGRSFYDFSPEHVKRSVHRSLERIGVDHLDIVLIHSNGDDLTIIRSMGTLEALLDLQSKGLIRTTGLSGKTVAGGLEAIERGASALMATLHLEDDGDLPLIQAAERAGVGVLVKKPFNSGHLASNEEAATQSLRHIFTVGGAGVASVVVGTLNPEHLRRNMESAQRGLEGQV